MKDVNVPPRFIFDPPPERPGAFSAKEMSSGSRSRRSRRSRHPSHWNEVELRVQLWDSYRLARIILGTPIRSFALSSKTILHSIRQVAEMKLELIRLEKELQMTKVLLQASTDPDMGGGAPIGDSFESTLSGQSTLFPGSSTSVQMADILMNTTRRSPVTTPAEDNQQGDPTEFPNGMTVEERIQVIQEKYHDLQITHEKMILEFQAKLSLIHSQLQTSLVQNETTLEGGTKSETLEETNGLPLVDLPNELVVASNGSNGNTFKPIANGTKSGSEGDTDKVEASTSQQLPNGSPTQAQHQANVISPEKVSLSASKAGLTSQAGSAPSSSNTLQGMNGGTLKGSQLSPDLAGEAHLQAMGIDMARLNSLSKMSLASQDSEHGNSHWNSAASMSSIELLNVPTTEPDTDRQQLQALVQQLMQQVDMSSAETKEKFQSLDEHLQLAWNSSHSVGGMNLPMDSGASATESIPVKQFEKRMKTAQTLHSLEMETLSIRSQQQVSDMSGQLEAYQHQVERQHSELHHWRQKYSDIEDMSVAPSEATEVLLELEALTPDASDEVKKTVYDRVCRLLRRLTQLQARQETERLQMQQTAKAAAVREAETTKELDHLRLQKKLLKHDTKISKEDWQNQLGQQRKRYNNAMAALFAREEDRLLEIERLEVELTELAFLAVEIEDLEMEYNENEEAQESVLRESRQSLRTSTPQLQHLQSQVKETAQIMRNRVAHMGEQVKEWGSKEPGSLTPRLEYLARLGTTEEQLARREKELRDAQSDLAASQQRVQELEATIRKLQDSSTH
eukprot:Nitzschia sp. Nitz4//scaffold139_size61406//54686//57064//NITZ4_006468-RA/size61406-processed-gene-0.88-mRNA-1//-1//CDS//3329535876//7053//frame0